jgi:tetratricopeptide (TPR) repeat protein
MQKARAHGGVFSLVLFLLTAGHAGALNSLQSTASINSEEALQLATQLLQRGKLAQAEQQARLALSDPGSAPVAYAVLGALRLQQKKYTESISFLERALRLEPRLVGARLNLAQACELAGRPNAEALMAYKRVLDYDALNAIARQALAASEAEQGHYQQSLNLARPVLASLKQNPAGLFVLATDFVKQGDRHAAAALAENWIKLADVPTEWSMRFALLLANAGCTSEATDVLEHAKQTARQSYELTFNLAGIWLLRGDLERALENYEAAAALKPDSIPAMCQAAEVAERRGELERSLSWWIRAKKLQPEKPEILFGFGRVSLKMDLLEDAEPALARAVELRPQDASYRYALASARVGKKQFESAELLLKDLVAKRPGDAQLHYALGAVFYLESKLDEAERELRQSVKLQPNQLASWYYLGVVSRDQGKNEDAVRIFQQVLHDHPSHAPSYEALGTVLIRMRRYPEAKVNLEKAVELNPKSVKASYQLGLLLNRMGEKEQAAKRLEMAKSMRQEDEATSRLQLRLLDPEK